MSVVVFEEDRPSNEDSDDSGVHLKQSRDFEGGEEGKKETEAGLEGVLLWAKIRGFSYWPAVVTVDPFEGLTLSKSSNGRQLKTHVHFLAYDNLRAWVPEGDTLPYEGYEKFRELASTLPKRKKDFEPGKKFRNIFERAVKEAEGVLGLPLGGRLQKLGFVYVPTNGEGSRVLAKKKRSSPSKKPQHPKRDTSMLHEEDSDLLSEPEDAAAPKDDGPVPKLGSLIWGHMPGFPFWPCFVTRSPDGDYIREGKGNHVSVHVQFFNWNDESAWVSKILPWCSLEEFRRQGKKSDWCPVGKMFHKWKNAALEAASTVQLSRRERHNRFLAVKTSHLGRTSRRSAPKSPPSMTTSTRLPPGWLIRIYSEKDYGSEARTEYQSPDGAVFLTIENAISYLFQQNNAGRRRKRSYSSPGGSVQSSTQLSSAPPGPASKKRRPDAGWFIRESDSLRYDSAPLRPGVGYLDLDDTVSYEADDSLPRGWTVKRLKKDDKTPARYLAPGHFSQPRREFGSKASAASYFEGMGHPAVELEHVIVTGMLQARSRGPLFKVDEYLPHRLRESPNMVKIVSPTFVKVARLPKEALDCLASSAIMHH